MLLQLTNTASALLATSINTTDTSFAVASGFGAKFPALTSGQWFPVVMIDASGNTEIMRATARSGDVITVTRAQEGTTARSFTTGARVELRMTAEALKSEIQTLEANVGGITTHAVTGGTLDLSATAFAEGIQKFSGSLTSDLTVIVPNKAKRFMAINATAGAFFLVMKTSSGSAICIPQGTEKDITCDGANVLYRADRNDVGKIEPFAGSTAPSGTFLCDGSAKIRLLTPDLFGRIGTLYGAPSGSTYTLPDYVTNNRFLRAAGGALAVGTYQAADIGPHNHSASGTVSGTNGSITPSGTIGSTTAAGSVSGTTAGGTVGSTTAGGTVGSTTAGGTVGSTTAGGSVGSTTADGTVSVSTPTGSVSVSTPSGTIGSTTATGSVSTTVFSAGGTSSFLTSQPTGAIMGALSGGAGVYAIDATATSTFTGVSHGHTFTGNALSASFSGNALSASFSGISHDHVFSGISHDHAFTGVSHGHAFAGNAHDHVFSGISHDHAFSGVSHGHTFTGNAVTPSWSGSVSITVANSTGVETRPNNGAALFCIHY